MVIFRENIIKAVINTKLFKNRNILHKRNKTLIVCKCVLPTANLVAVLASPGLNSANKSLISRLLLSNY